MLKPDGILALELGFSQVEAITQLASAFPRREIIPDLAGIPRVLVCNAGGLAAGSFGS